MDGIDENKIRKDLIKQHGDFKNQFRYLVEITDKSIKALFSLFSAG